MSPEDRQAALQEAMERLFELPPERIVPTARLYEDLDIDSIDAVNLVIELRRMSGRQIGAEHFKDVRTVADVDAVLARVLDAPA